MNKANLLVILFFPACNLLSFAAVDTSVLTPLCFVSLLSMHYASTAAGVSQIVNRQSSIVNRQFPLWPRLCKNWLIDNNFLY